MLPLLSRDDELFKHTSKLTMASLLSKMLLLDCMGKGDGVNDAPSGPVFQNNKVTKFLENTSNFTDERPIAKKNEATSVPKIRPRKLL
jgi:hypothetical protein